MKLYEEHSFTKKRADLLEKMKIDLESQEGIVCVAFDILDESLLGKKSDWSFEEKRTQTVIELKSFSRSACLNRNVSSVNASNPIILKAGLKKW